MDPDSYWNPVNRCLFTLGLFSVLLLGLGHPVLALMMVAAFFPLFRTAQSRVLTPVTISLAVSISQGLVMSSPLVLFLVGTLFGSGPWRIFGHPGDFSPMDGEAYQIFLLLLAFPFGLLWMRFQSGVFVSYGFHSCLYRNYTYWTVFSIGTFGVGFLSMPIYGLYQVYRASKDLSRVRSQSRT